MVVIFCVFLFFAKLFCLSWSIQYLWYKRLCLLSRCLSVTQQKINMVSDAGKCYSCLPSLIVSRLNWTCQVQSDETSWNESENTPRCSSGHSWKMVAMLCMLHFNTVLFLRSISNNILLHNYVFQFVEHSRAQEMRRALKQDRLFKKCTSHIHKWINHFYQEKYNDCKRNGHWSVQSEMGIGIILWFSFPFFEVLSSQHVSFPLWDHATSFKEWNFQRYL